MNLLDDILAAEPGPECTLCAFILTLDGDTKEAMIRASGGTIGVNKLAGILKDHETGIGRRTIERHRKENHAP